jgi:hypothetical protein
MADGDPTTKDMIDYAWRYFDLHSGQRISLFNFFLVVSGSGTAGLAAAVEKGNLFLVLGGALGCLLVLVSFVFWKLDQRTAFLIKHAEDALIQLEARIPSTEAQLVSREPARTAEHREGFVLARMWTYGTIFHFVFWAMGAVGVAGVVLSWSRFYGWIG